MWGWAAHLLGVFSPTQPSWLRWLPSTASLQGLPAPGSLSVTKDTWLLDRGALAQGHASILLLRATGFQADEALHLPDTSILRDEGMADEHPCRVSLHSLSSRYYVCVLSWFRILVGERSMASIVRTSCRVKP